MHRGLVAHLSIVGFSSMILWWVRIFNEVEVNGVIVPCLTPCVSNRIV